MWDNNILGYINNNGTKLKRSRVKLSLIVTYAEQNENEYTEVHHFNNIA